MQVFLSIFLTNLLVPLILRFIVFKSQSSKSPSPYTFKYPKYLSIIFIVAIVIIIALFSGAYLSDAEPSLELEIFLGSFYSLFTIALIWQLMKVLNFQLILEEDFILYRNLLGIVQKIRYDEVSKIKTYNDKFNNPIKYKIYICKKWIEVDNFIINFKEFPKIMKKRLKRVKSSIQIL